MAVTGLPAAVAPAGILYDVQRSTPKLLNHTIIAMNAVFERSGKGSPLYHRSRVSGDWLEELLREGEPT